MATPRVKCSLCKKTIVGTVKLVTYRKKLGKKSVNVVELYDTECFKLKNKARSTNERDSKKRTNQRKNNKRSRV